MGYLLVRSDTYENYYVRRAASRYQWSYSKNGYWQDIDSIYVDESLKAQLDAYFGTN